MKVAIYANIGNKMGQDTKSQLDQLLNRARELDRQVYVFVDQDAGRTSERPELQKLFVSASLRDFQVLLVWSLDRFIGERVDQALVNIQRLLRCHVQLISCTEPYLCSGGPAGAFIIPIAAWFAQQEHIRISERTKAGLAKARAKTKGLGRPRKLFPLERVAADRKAGKSWRQLEQKYGVPQATLRDALSRLLAAVGPQTDNTDNPGSASAREESRSAVSPDGTMLRESTNKRIKT